MNQYVGLGGRVVGVLVFAAGVLLMAPCSWLVSLALTTLGVDGWRAGGFWLMR